MECTNCDGRGYVRHICEECGGSGYIDCLHWGTPEVGICDKCVDGSIEDDCKSCDGTGEIDDPQEPKTT